MYGVLVAQDQRNALRTGFSYAVAPFDIVPALTRMVPSGWRALWKKARRSDSLTLDNGFRIACYPCRPAAVRGIRARVIVLDELAFYRSSEGVSVDAEMVRAARPCLATTGGKLVVLSSPYAQTGALYDLHRKHFGRDDGTVLVWQASASVMNPTLPADYLMRMQLDDPEAYASEVLGEFRQGLTAFLDPEAIAACVAEGVREQAPQRGREYVAFFDASGGRQDAAVLAIAHAEADRAVLDVVRPWPAPHNPSGVIAEAVGLLRRYRLSKVTGDRYAADFVAEGFRSHAIDYVASDRDRSALYLELLPAVNAGSIVLLDDADLLRELRSLERRRGPSGRDRVDHRPGAHDDRSNAAAGALVLAAERASKECRFCDDRSCDGLPPFGLMDSPYVTEWYARHPGPDAPAIADTVDEPIDDVETSEIGDPRHLNDDVAAVVDEPDDGTTWSSNEIAAKMRAAATAAQTVTSSAVARMRQTGDLIRERLTRPPAPAKAKQQRRKLNEFEQHVTKHRSWFPGDPGGGPPGRAGW